MEASGRRGQSRANRRPERESSVLSDVDTFWLGNDNAPGIAGEGVANVAVASVETTDRSGSKTNGEGGGVETVAQAVGGGGVANVTVATAGGSGRVTSVTGVDNIFHGAGVKVGRATLDGQPVDSQLLLPRTIWLTLAFAGFHCVKTAPLTTVIASMTAR